MKLQDQYFDFCTIAGEEVSIVENDNIHLVIDGKDAPEIMLPSLFTDILGVKRGIINGYSFLEHINTETNEIEIAGRKFIITFRDQESKTEIRISQVSNARMMYGDKYLTPEHLDTYADLFRGQLTPKEAEDKVEEINQETGLMQYEKIRTKLVEGKGYTEFSYGDNYRLLLKKEEPGSEYMVFIGEEQYQQLDLELTGTKDGEHYYQFIQDEKIHAMIFNGDAITAIAQLTAANAVPDEPVTETEETEPEETEEVTETEESGTEAEENETPAGDHEAEK